MTYIVVPYRDREEHLGLLFARLGPLLSAERVHVVVSIQPDGQLFNRGLTRNVGVKYALAHGAEQVVLHDVDMLPVDLDVYWAMPERPVVHLAGRASQFNGQMPYPRYFGGVLRMTATAITACNGMTNRCWGWGAEDDVLLRRVMLLGYQPAWHHGVFQSIDHAREQRHKHNNHNRRILQTETLGRLRSDGLTSTPSAHIVATHPQVSFITYELGPHQPPRI